MLTVYALSAASAVTGGVLIAMDTNEAEPTEPGTLKITPLLAPDSAGLQLGISW